jgi:hypothetical protein
MAASAIVEDLDVVEGLGRGLSARRAAVAVDALVLEAVEPAIGRGLAPAVPLRLIEQLVP